MGSWLPPNNNNNNNNNNKLFFSPTCLVFSFFFFIMKTFTEIMFAASSSPWNNPYQGADLRVLFVCSAGILRSATAARIYGNIHNTRCAGSEDYALIPITDRLLAWAQEIVFVNVANYNTAAKRWNMQELRDNGKIIKILSIPDSFPHMDPKLIKAFEQQYGPTTKTPAVTPQPVDNLAERKGLLAINDGIIVHGCNCQGVMGSGVAAQVRKVWPEVYVAYIQDKPKLGEIQIFSSTKLTDRLHHLGGYEVPALPEDLVVINALTQDNFGRDGRRYVDYTAVGACFARIALVAEATGKTVYYPRIGAGLGGGDWNIIQKIISQQLGNLKHELVDFP